MSIFFYFLAIFISAVVSYEIYLGKYSPFFIFLWLLSILLLLAALLFNQSLKIKYNFQFNKKTFIILLIIIIPALVRIVYFNPNRTRGDDLLTAYFSAHFDPTTINFFSGIPQDKAQWVSQFPTPFFALQKLFFLIFGESYLSIQFSIIPYVLIISLMLFLISKMIFGFKTAAAAVIFYSFFAANLYLETLGLHFISSTAVFLVFFYLLILYGKTRKSIFASLSGITCGFCYLFYITSFIAFPVMILYFIVHIVFSKKLLTMYHLLLAVLGFLIVLSPFITYAYRFDNYFSSRIDQVSLLSGNWSGIKDQIAHGANPFRFIKDNSVQAIKSLYIDGIGGHGGYDFGHLAFFEKSTLYLFLFGTATGIILMFLIKRKIELLLIYLIMAVSFISGVILTLPPPAYHRFSLAFPFLALIFSLPIYIFLKLKNYFKLLALFTILCLVIVYSINNQIYFQRTISTEFYNESIFISNYINKNFPNRNIYVASYPGFGFDKVYYFSAGKNAKSISTGYHDGFLKTFNPDEKYVYAIIFPEDFNSKFAALDKDGRIIKISQGYSLFVN